MVGNRLCWGFGCLKHDWRGYKVSFKVLGFVGDTYISSVSTEAYCIHLGKKNHFFLSNLFFGLFFWIIFFVFSDNFFPLFFRVFFFLYFGVIFFLNHRDTSNSREKFCPASDAYGPIVNNRKVLRCLRRIDKLMVIPSIWLKDRTISQCLKPSSK